MITKNDNAISNSELKSIELNFLKDYQIVLSQLTESDTISDDRKENIKVKIFFNKEFY